MNGKHLLLELGSSAVERDAWEWGETVVRDVGWEWGKLQWEGMPRSGGNCSGRCCLRQSGHGALLSVFKLYYLLSKFI